jgi:hypothetical protein
MAQFRATIQGQRGPASRLGHKKSGITASINGWDSGVSVSAEHVYDRDRFWVTATGGSNGRQPQQCLGVIEVIDGTLTFRTYADVMRNGEKHA